MVATLLYMSGEQFLALKSQSIVSMTIFGVLIGLLLRQAFRAIEEPGVLERDTSNRSAARPPRRRPAPLPPADARLLSVGAHVQYTIR